MWPPHSPPYACPISMGSSLGTQPRALSHREKLGEKNWPEFLGACLTGINRSLDLNKFSGYHLERNKVRWSKPVFWIPES